MKKFRKVAVGGTFDELHRGHKTLLTESFAIGERVIIGLSSDELVAKLGKPHVTANYAEREQGLKEWLSNLGFEKRSEIIPLLDAFGSTIRDLEIEALVVSEETKPTAEKINVHREKAGLPPLKIVTINMVPSQNCSPISTTRIRRGEMDREGRLLKTSRQ
ncbi:MAG TPA: pantetheine-phosphate adenylyltransferase [Candidatus Acidoferrales bacterium]|nr:pantetheine-phosphate adenylyltransferase [Candidatus Acidoferrales bacterium]